MNVFVRFISYLHRFPGNVIAFFVMWRSTLELVAWWIDPFVPDGNRPYPISVPAQHLLGYWAKWDSVYYHQIIEHGYRIDLLAFFPVFPGLVRILSFISNHPVLLAMIVVNLAALGTFLLLYKLARLDGDQQYANRAVMYLAIFPTSFFLISHYTESIFLVTALASFYFARQRSWWMAGLFGGIASLTRVTGIILFPALLVEALGQNWRGLHLKNLSKKQLPLLLIPAGLAVYIGYAWLHFASPLAFVHQQVDFGRTVTLNLFAPVLEAIHRIIEPGQFYTASATDNFNYVLFWFLFILAAGLVLKFTRPSYGILVLLMFLIPAFSGTLISINRFLLVAFPIYLMLARVIPPNSWLERSYVFVSVLLLAVLTILFTNAQWVG